MRRLRVVLLVLIAALVVALTAIQTESAFAWVIVPLANVFAPGSVEVSRGRLGLAGTLEAEGLRFDSETLGVRVAASELFVNLTLSSLVRGPGPRLDELRLSGAEIDVMPVERSADEEQAGPARQWPERLVLPLSIAQADLRDVRLRVYEGEPAWAELNSEQLTITGLVPGGTGSVTWSATTHVQPAGDTAHDATLALDAQIEQSANGSIESWTLSLVSDVSGPAAAKPTHFTLDAKGSLPAGKPLTASVELRAERAGAMLGQITASASTSAGPESRSVLDASLELRSLTEAFLNPLLAPLRRGRIRRAKVAGRFELTTDLPPQIGTLPTRASGELAIDRFHYRTLEVSGGRLRVAVTPKKMDAELLPMRINRGHVSARLSREVSVDEERLHAVLETQKLDLTALANAFREDLPATVEGILDLSATLSSRAPPGTDLRRTANGSVRTRLERGRIEGFDPMAFLANESGVEAFKAIPIDDFDLISNTPIENGVVKLHETELRAAAAELVLNGTIELAGEADVTIEAFVGPSVGATLGRFGIELNAVKEYERMTSLPVAIHVSGPLDELSYGPTTPRTAQRAGDAAGSVGEAADTAGEQVDKALKGVTDLFKRQK